MIYDFIFTRYYSDFLSENPVEVSLPGMLLNIYKLFICFVKRRRNRFEAAFFYGFLAGGFGVKVVLGNCFSHQFVPAGDFEPFGY